MVTKFSHICSFSASGAVIFPTLLSHLEYGMFVCSPSYLCVCVCARGRPARVVSTLRSEMLLIRLSLNPILFRHKCNISECSLQVVYETEINVIPVQNVYRKYPTILRMHTIFSNSFIIIQKSFSTCEIYIGCLTVLLYNIPFDDIMKIYS